MSKLRKMYNENGYVIYRNLLSHVTLRALMADITYIIVQATTVSELENDNLPQALESLAKVKELYISVLSLCAKTASLQRVFLDDEIMGVIKRLGLSSPCIPSPPVLNVVGEKIKLNGGYSGTEAHQDWPSLQGSLDEITVWMPFTLTENNYPLEVIPGSHLKGLRDGKVSGSVLEVATKGENFTPLPCAPGDVIFMSGFLVHRTGVGGSSVRLAASMRFDNVDEGNFIIRGFPCAQKRSVTRELITPNFPTIKQIAEIFQ